MIDMTDRKIYRRRPMRGMTAQGVQWAQLGDPDGLPLSAILRMNHAGRLFLCGSLEQMSREFVEEPLRNGWEFARPYIHKFRSPVYKQVGTEKQVAVKLVGESWLPGCESLVEGVAAWGILQREWATETALPLLSTPSKTGQAFLLENLPKATDFPALPDELAILIRSIAPQHRLQTFVGEYGLTEAEVSTDEELQIQTHAYDGRWMYAGAATTDRLPVGEARKVGGFVKYQPGWHRVIIRVPQTWAHIGLVPVPAIEHGSKVWTYPNEPGQEIDAWVSEPELTLAIDHGWEIIRHIDGYAFEKGRPLQTWAKKLIKMRQSLQAQAHECGNGRFASLRFAAAAIREILNHTIGSFHVDTYERESVVSKDEHRELIAQWGYAKVRTLETLRGGKRRVIHPARHGDKLSIYMPHWSAQIWALERAWIAKHALRCPFSSLLEIRGDAIYMTERAPFEDEDEGHLSQLRRKEA